MNTISRHAQTLVTGNALISPPTLNHTEVITVQGVARTSLIIISIIGITDGALVRVRLILPATADIILQIVNVSSSGTVLSTVTTGTVLDGLLTFCYNESDATWQPISYELPST